MPELVPSDFAAFFEEVHGYSPYPWQRRLAERACGGGWPHQLALPTGSGKTATLDVAVFALAVQAALSPQDRTAARRIFFVVNRRLIVDEAHDRALRLAEALAAPPTGQTPAVRKVAAALRAVGGAAEAPLRVHRLRGGIARDAGWPGSRLAQPMIVTSTLDQFGSRLLFSGYGVSDLMAPVHAALCACDSLLLFDEAHISGAFVETLEGVDRYQQYWRQSADALAPVQPLRVVLLSATQARAQEGSGFGLEPQDREQNRLRRVLSARKDSILLAPVAGKRPKASDSSASRRLTEALAKAMSEKARELHKIVDESGEPGTVVVFANRVATAREIHQRLYGTESQSTPGGFAPAELVIGRMRPWDRDALYNARLKPLKTGTAHQADAPRYVVTTQCLEVGADFDFAAIVTECASIDALRQRFGRVNRAGNRTAPAPCAIVVGEASLLSDKDLADEKQDGDPIYGKALTRTWNWLRQIATKDCVVDFGIDSMDAHLARLRADAGEAGVAALMSPTGHAPVLLPSYLDQWTQTAPRPEPGPDPSEFIHGAERGNPVVQVCWRGDLPPEDDQAKWAEAVGALHPTAQECMPIPLADFLRWWNDGELPGGSDLEDEAAIDTESNAAATTPARPTFLHGKGRNQWKLARGSDSQVPLRPGETVVLRAQDGGATKLGHIWSAPESAPPGDGEDAATPLVELPDLDIADKAASQVTGMEVLRLWPGRFQNGTLDRLRVESAQRPVSRAEWAEAITEWAATAEREVSRLPKPGELRVDAYLETKEDPRGPSILLRWPRGLQAKGAYSPEVDGEDDDLSLNSVAVLDRPVSLGAHTEQVVRETRNNASQLGLDRLSEPLSVAALCHDLGKADPRFQALLMNAPLLAGYATRRLLAKSHNGPVTPAGRAMARERASLPKGFRHEMLSSQLAQGLPAAVGSAHRDLILHLIEAHHGHGRPFAPVVFDPAPPEVELADGAVAGVPLMTLEVGERSERPGHALDSGVAERFWRLQRQLGPWGLAFLETVLRMADHAASALPDPEALETGAANAEDSR